MIEKFTAEELAQLRAELREMDRTSQKDKLIKEQVARAVRVLGIRKTDALRMSFTLSDVKGAITLLADHATKNYTAKPNGGLKRNSLVPGGMEGQYLEAVTRIVDTLEEIAEPLEDVV